VGHSGETLSTSWALAWAACLHISGSAYVPIWAERFRQSPTMYLARVEGESLANYTAVTTLVQVIRADGETPVDTQREANVQRVQRCWEEYQKSGAVSARAIEELV
jgi:hypothetical protein